MYNLKIENTRTLTSSSLLYNYIDNITLEPMFVKFSVDDNNIPCMTGKTVNFSLTAGNANGGKNYWIWMSASGNYPGINLNGITVPLNWDPLFTFGLYNPAIPGSVGFLGVLDGTGKATASLAFPSDLQKQLVGFPIHLAYVLTSPGPSLPISLASEPIHVKYIP